MAIKKRCLRCLKVMRNDGTADNPKWVCNNPKCVKYKPQPEPEQEPTPEPTPEPEQEQVNPALFNKEVTI